MKSFIKRIVKVGTNNEPSRVAWLEKTIKNIPAGNRILDAGAGERQFKSFCSHLKYVSQDFGQYNGKGDGVAFHTKEWDQENLDIVSDIVNIPEPDGSFDAIMCTEVFEHLPDPVLAIKEFSRLLKSGGTLVITAPFCSATHFAPFHYCTGFSRYYYEKHLPENGFEIVEVVPDGNFYDFLAQEIMRLPLISKRYNKKWFSPIDYLLSFMMLMSLRRLSRGDTGSSEFLTFDYHVLAKKK